MTMKHQTTQPRQGLTAAPGLFSLSSAHPGQAVPAAVVLGCTYTPPPACSLCVPVRPLAGFRAVRGYLYHPGHKSALRGKYDGLRRRAKGKPRQAVNLSGAVGAISISSGASGASSSQASFSRWRGLASGYCTGSSRPGSYNSPDHIGAAVRTP